MSNELGQRGEFLFSTIITRFYGRDTPIFRPYFLGDKWPLVDFVVELLNAGDVTPYFFAQVKTTRSGYTKIDKRLRVHIRWDDMRKLALYPAPTYIVGIDDVWEEGYIISANGEWLSRMSSFPTTFPLNEPNQIILWEEVKEFWTTGRLRRFASHFLDPRWR